MATKDPDAQGKGASPGGVERDSGGGPARPGDRKRDWSPAQPHEAGGSVGDETVVDIDATNDPSKD